MPTNHIPGTSVVDLYKAKTSKGLPINPHAKRWLARAQKRPGVARFTTKAFHNEAEAWAWAGNQVAKYRLGIDSGERCTLSGLYDEYIDHLSRRGVSPGHLAKAKTILRDVIDNGINDLKDERFPDKVEAYFGSLRIRLTNRSGGIRRRNDKEVSPRTKNAYMSHVLAICAYAKKRRYIPYDPLSGIVSQFKEPKSIKPTFSLNELRVILSDEYRSEPYWLPFAISVYSGLRIGETMHLEWDDILAEEKRILVRMKPKFYRLKGQKERYATLQPELARILADLPRTSNWVIPEKPRVKQNMWAWYFSHLLKAARVPKNRRSPHSTRHTWASLSVACGRDPFDVMALAGHSSLNTTLRYAQAASLYRDAVTEWEKGTFSLRPTPFLSQTIRSSDAKTIIFARGSLDHDEEETPLSAP